MVQLLDVANLIIALVVLFFVWRFLQQHKGPVGRTAWVILFFGTILFFLVEVANLLGYFTMIGLPGLRSFIEAIYIALVLFVFIFHYDRIHQTNFLPKKKK